MKIGNGLRFLTILIAIVIVFHSCENSSISPPEAKIKLHWTTGYDGELRENVMLGLAWNLSFLGAKLPKGSMEKAVHWDDDTHFTLDINQLGFSVKAVSQLRELLSLMKESGEYKITEAINIGRFVSLMVNCSNQYYAITDTKTTYQTFRSSFRFSDSRAAIVESGVANGNRIIEISTGNSINQIAFIAHEGSGSLLDGTFEATEFEVFDFMENGQLRFAIYDAQGNLKVSADPSFTSAGKPAKCLWCHEIVIQPPFFAQTDVLGYLSTNEFKTIIEQKMNLITQYRETLSSEINYGQRQAHTQAELLYLSFMEPSAERLAIEWQIEVAEIREILQGIPTHEHGEFTFLGSALYHRKDVDNLAPFQCLKVADYAREFSDFEPNYLLK